MIQSVKLLFKDLQTWIVLEKYRGKSIGRILIISLPLNLFNRLYSSLAGFFNNFFLIYQLNSKRFQEFQNFHQNKLGDHFYIIVMPNTLPYLVPCLHLIPKNINLFLILNGIAKWEDNFLRESYKNIPIFKLKLFPHSVLSHGRVLNVLLTHNQYNFGIIDHDLYILNRDIFGKLNFSADEFIIGIYKITNTTSQLTFPATQFLFFNVPLIKNIMLKYNIGAQKYRRIPSRLIKKLASLKIGYHNFLKEYLNYFDTLNLIMAMGFYEKLSAKIIEVKLLEDEYHLGVTSHGPDNLYRTYTNLKFLELPQNQALRERYSNKFSPLNISKDMVKLFPDNIDSVNFVQQTDQFFEKLEKSLQD